AIVPGVRHELDRVYIEAVETKAAKQISADGELLILWPEVSAQKKDGGMEELRYPGAVFDMDGVTIVSSIDLTDIMFDGGVDDKKERIEIAIRQFMDDPMPLVIRCQSMHYDWGDTQYIPALLRIQNRAGNPYAELWIGAHPDAPAKADIFDIEIDLKDLIAAAAEEILGRDTAFKYNSQLPYLFKVLVAATALSIQAHPDKEQAWKGYAREDKQGIERKAKNRNYKDANHKPEMVCALSFFWAFNGFRAIEDIIDSFEEIAVPELSEEFAAFKSAIKRAGGDAEARRGALRGFYTGIMSNVKELKVAQAGGDKTAERQAQGKITPVVRHVVEYAKQKIDKYSGEDLSAKTFQEIIEAVERQGKVNELKRELWVLRLNGQYPDDMGVLSAYLLNLVRLEPGQAMYLPAGELHAYLGRLNPKSENEGASMEIMANSNNVLRGGLTPKHIDVPELLATLTFNSGAPKILTPQKRSEEESVYNTPAEEFELSVIEVEGDKEFVSVAEHSADALIVLEGEATLTDSRNNRLELQRGDTILVPAVSGTYTIKGAAKIYKAGVPVDGGKVDVVQLVKTGEYAQTEEELFGSMDLLKTLAAVNNSLKDEYCNKGVSKEDIREFNSRVFARALGLPDLTLSRSIQIIVSQMFNILFWIDSGIEGAEEIELTSDESKMPAYSDPNKYPIKSFIDKDSLPVKVTGEEFTCGFFWRGYEGSEKLGRRKGSTVTNIREDLVYDAELFTGRIEKIVMYAMNHGFITAGNLREITGKKEDQVSTIHETVFLHDSLPGSLQAVSTGIGHLQGLSLDIKQVTEGKGIQFNILYSLEGDIVEILAQYLTPGTWTLALPGYVDSVVNLGGLRFSDISRKLTPAEARRISPKFGEFTGERLNKVEAEFKKVEFSPYLPVFISEESFLLKNIDDAPPVTWIKGPDYGIFADQKERLLVDLYRTLTEERLTVWISAINKDALCPESAAIKEAAPEAVRKDVSRIKESRGISAQEVLSKIQRTDTCAADLIKDLDQDCLDRVIKFLTGIVENAEERISKEAEISEEEISTAVRSATILCFMFRENEADDSRYIYNPYQRIDQAGSDRFWGRAEKLYAWGMARNLDQTLQKVGLSFSDSYADYRQRGPKIASEYVDGKAIAVKNGARIEFNSGVGNDHVRIAMDMGAKVINISVLFKDEQTGAYEPMITAKIQRIAELAIVLKSEDWKVESEKGPVKIDSLEDLFDLDKQKAVKLHKAAIIASGIVPQGALKWGVSLEEIMREFGGGFALTTHVKSIPVGSGLGTSSALGATVLSSLIEFSGQNKTDEMKNLTDGEKKMLVVARTLFIEQMIGALGGWQDACAIYPVIKLIEADKGEFLPHPPQVLPVSEKAKGILKEALVLVDQGFRQDSAESAWLFRALWAIRDPRIVEARKSSRRILLEELALFDSLSDDSRSDDEIKKIIARLGQLENEDWENRIIISPPATNSYIEAVNAGLRIELGIETFGYDSTGSRGGAGGVYLLDLTKISREEFIRTLFRVTGEIKETLAGELKGHIGGLTIYDWQINDAGEVIEKDGGGWKRAIDAEEYWEDMEKSLGKGKLPGEVLVTDLLFEFPDFIGQAWEFPGLLINDKKSGEFKKAIKAYYNGEEKKYDEIVERLKKFRNDILINSPVEPLSEDVPADIREYWDGVINDYIRKPWFINITQEHLRVFEFQLKNKGASDEEIKGLEGELQEFVVDDAEFKGTEKDNMPWSIAASYFYIKILETTKYWKNGVDPFIDKKNYQRETGAQDFINNVDIQQLKVYEEQGGSGLYLILSTMLDVILLGNQYSDPTHKAEGKMSGRYPVDNLSEVVNYLISLQKLTKQGEKTELHILHDNVGLELVCLLWLVDICLRKKIVSKVVLHTKNYPYSVSDVTTPFQGKGDVDLQIDVLSKIPSLEINEEKIKYAKYMQELSGRLKEYIEESGLRVTIDNIGYSTIGRDFVDMPVGYYQELKKADLIMYIGDMWYRKLFLHRNWDFAADSKKILSYLPAPSLVVRMGKSPILAGADEYMARTLRQEADGPEPWWANPIYGILDYLPEEKVNKYEKVGKPVDLDEENEKIYKDLLYIFGQDEKILLRSMAKAQKATDRNFTEFSRIDGEAEGVETVLEAPDILLISNGSTGNFFAHKFSQAMAQGLSASLEGNGRKIGVVVSPYDNTGGSKILQDSLAEKYGYIISPEKSMNVLAGFLSEAKRQVFLATMGKNDRGLLRDKVKELLKIVTEKDKDNLDNDWLYFCSQMLRIAEGIDEKFIKTGELTIAGNCISTFIWLYVMVNAEAFDENTKKVDVDKYAAGFKQLCRILGISEGYVLPASFEKGNLYALLEGISITRGKETAEVVNTKEGLLVKIRDTETTRATKEFEIDENEREDIEINGLKISVCRQAGRIIIEINGVRSTVIEELGDYISPDSKVIIRMRDDRDEVLNNDAESVTLDFNGETVELRSRLVIGQGNINHIIHYSQIEETGFLDKADPEVYRQLESMIRGTKDAIIVAPGALNTDLIPILMTKGVSEALRNRKEEGLPTVFIFNPVNDCETVDYSVTEIIEQIEQATRFDFASLFSHAIVNVKEEKGASERLKQTIKNFKDVHFLCRELSMPVNVEVDRSGVHEQKDIIGYDSDVLAEMLDKIFMEKIEISKEYQQLLTVYRRKVVLEREIRRTMSQNSDLNCKGAVLELHKRVVVGDLTDMPSENHFSAENIKDVVPNMPKLVISNFGHTLSPLGKNNEPLEVSREVIEGLEGFLSKGGMYIVISGWNKEKTVENLVYRVNPELRHRMIIAPSSGSEAWGFDKKGNVQIKPIYANFSLLWDEYKDQVSIIVDTAMKCYSLDQQLFDLSGETIDEKIRCERREAQISLELDKRNVLSRAVAEQENKKIVKNNKAGKDNLPLHEMINGVYDVRNAVIKHLNIKFKEEGLPVIARKAGTGAINIVLNSLNKVRVVDLLLHHVNSQIISLAGEIENKDILVMGRGLHEVAKYLQDCKYVIFQLEGSVNDMEPLAKLYVGGPAFEAVGDFLKALHKDGGVQDDEPNREIEGSVMIMLDGGVNDNKKGGEKSYNAGDFRPLPDRFQERQILIPDVELCPSVDINNESVGIALAHLQSSKEYEMARYLENLVRFGHVRFGPLTGALAVIIGEGEDEHIFMLIYTGGGGLICSILTDLLVNGVAETLVQRKDIPRVFVLTVNIEAETYGLSLRDTIALFERSLFLMTGEKIKFQDMFDYIVIPYVPGVVIDKHLNLHFVKEHMRRTAKICKVLAETILSANGAERFSRYFIEYAYWIGLLHDFGGQVVFGDRDTLRNQALNEDILQKTIGWYSLLRKRGIPMYDGGSEIILFGCANVRTGADGYTWGKPWRESEILKGLGIIDESGLVIAADKLAEMGFSEEDLDENNAVVGEWWLGSDDKQYPTEVIDGNGRKMNLHDLLAEAGESILGKAHVAKYGPHMASIMKIIDAKEALSAQLHSAAMLRTGKGKNVPPKPEMWMYYRGTGTIYIGWKNDLSEERLRTLYDHSRVDLKEYDKEGKLVKELNRLEISGNSYRVLTPDGRVKVYEETAEGVSLRIEGKEYFYAGARVEITREQGKSGKDILLVRNLFELLLNKIDLRPETYVVVRGGMVHAIRGGTTLIEFSIAPSKADVGNLKDATLAFSDSLDGKQPRPAKEDLQGSIEVFNQDKSGINWQASSPERLYSIPKTVYEDGEDNRVRQLFGKETKVEVYEMTVGSGIKVEKGEQGYPLYVLEGSVEIRAGPGKGVILNASESAIIPATVRSYSLVNCSSKPSVMLKWNAPVDINEEISDGGNSDIQRNKIFPEISHNLGYQILLEELRNNGDINYWDERIKYFAESDEECLHIRIFFHRGYHDPKVLKINVPSLFLVPDNWDMLIKYLTVSIYNFVVCEGAEDIIIFTEDKIIEERIVNDIRKNIEAHYKKFSFYGNFGHEIRICTSKDFKFLITKELSQHDICLEPNSSILGVDIGGTNIKVVIISNNEVCYKNSFGVDRSQDGEWLRDNIIKIIDESIVKTDAEINAIGITFPSPIERMKDGRARVLRLTNFERYWKKNRNKETDFTLDYAAVNEIEIRLKEKFPSVEVAIMNDADAFGFADIAYNYQENGCNDGSKVVLPIGTGPGYVKIKDGEIEIIPQQGGHMVIEMSDDAEIDPGCEVKGCYGGYVPASAIPFRAQKMGIDITGGGFIAIDLNRTLKLLNDIGAHIAKEAVQIYKITGVGDIELSGGITQDETGEQLIKLANEYLRNNYPPLAENISIKRSKLDVNYSGAIGVAQYANFIRCDKTKNRIKWDRRCNLPESIIGSNIIYDELMKYHNNYCIVTTKEIKEYLTNQHYKWYINKEALTIDGKSIEEFKEEVNRCNSEILVIIGTGTVIDWGKSIGRLIDKKTIVIPSALSTNGMFTEKSIFYRDNNGNRIRVSEESGTVDRVIIDISFLKDFLSFNLGNIITGERANRAGAGDIVSIFPALLDWQLASDNGKELIDTVIFGRASRILEIIEENKNEVSENTTLGMVILSELMAEASLLNMRYGSSRPKDGSEHLLGDEIDKRLNSNIPRLHGEVVAIATMIMCYLYRDDYEPEAFDGMMQLIRDLGLPSNPSELGISKDIIIESLLNINTRKDKYTYFDNVELKQETVNEVYEALFGSKKNKISSFHLRTSQYVSNSVRKMDEHIDKVTSDIDQSTQETVQLIEALFEIHKIRGRVILNAAGRVGEVGMFFLQKLRALGFDVDDLKEITPEFLLGENDLILTLSGTGETFSVVDNLTKIDSLYKKDGFTNKIFSVTANRSAKIWGVVKEENVLIKISGRTKNDILNTNVDNGSHWLPLSSTFEYSVMLFLEGIIEALILKQVSSQATELIMAVQDTVESAHDISGGLITQIRSIESHTAEFINILITAQKEDHRVYIFGLGQNNYVARLFSRRIQNIGFESYVPGPRDIVSKAREGDVCIFLSNSGARYQTLEKIRIAKEIGCKTVVITANVSSSLAKSSQLAIQVFSDTTEAHTVDIMKNTAENKKIRRLKRLFELTSMFYLEGISVALMKELKVKENSLQHIPKAWEFPAQIKIKENERLLPDIPIEFILKNGNVEGVYWNQEIINNLGPVYRGIANERVNSFQESFKAWLLTQKELPSISGVVISSNIPISAQDQRIHIARIVGGKIYFSYALFRPELENYFRFCVFYHEIKSHFKNGVIVEEPTAIEDTLSYLLNNENIGKVFCKTLQDIERYGVYVDMENFCKKLLQPTHRVVSFGNKFDGGGKREIESGVLNNKLFIKGIILDLDVVVDAQRLYSDTGIIESGIGVLPDARTFIEQLQALGTQVALCSDHESAAEIISRTGLDEIIQIVVTGKNVPWGKPSPDLLWLAVEKMKLADYQVAVFGSAQVDIESGVRANLGMVAGVNRNNISQVLLQSGADIVVNNLNDFMAEELFTDRELFVKHTISYGANNERGWEYRNRGLINEIILNNPQINGEKYIRLLYAGYPQVIKLYVGLDDALSASPTEFWDRREYILTILYLLAAYLENELLDYDNIKLVGKLRHLRCGDDVTDVYMFNIILKQQIVLQVLIYDPTLKFQRKPKMRKIIQNVYKGYKMLVCDNISIHEYVEGCFFDPANKKIISGIQKNHRALRNYILSLGALARGRGWLLPHKIDPDDAIIDCDSGEITLIDIEDYDLVNRLSADRLTLQEYAALAAKQDLSRLTLLDGWQESSRREDILATFIEGFRNTDAGFKRTLPDNLKILERIAGDLMQFTKSAGIYRAWVQYDPEMLLVRIFGEFGGKDEVDTADMDGGEKAETEDSGEKIFFGNKVRELESIARKKYIQEPDKKKELAELE
ncbi:MAG: mannose-6-phosphate isomerase, class I, partial [Candidatus Omnitrophica bacterium]|nr:mannose-6-phosphate isomerase, class I [Candidatus Omnitrophota bacterium]